MIFNNRKIKPIILPFNWAAEYFNGDYLTEYDLITNKKNEFYSIKQNSVIRFGLFGQGMKLFFENYSGVFNLNGHRTEIIYKANGKEFLLTNTRSKRDLITYKKVYSDINLKGSYHKNVIESINFGYKTNINYGDLMIHFQPIVSLPFSKSASLNIKLTSNQDVPDGEIIFIRNNNEIERLKAPLLKNESGYINWIIK